MLQPNDEFLFTRQRHEADVMGLHYDLRFVHGDKAYSFATLKDMPKPGEIISVFEQPVHTASYALSKKVIIPKGQYGAGTTTLDWVRKAIVAPHSTETSLVIFTKDGQKFLLKKAPTKDNPTSWIFRNITGMGKSENPYLKKAEANLEKAAKEKHTARDLAIGTIGTGFAANQADKVLGYHKVYHGTSKDIAKKIQKEGFDPKMGGTGSAKYSDRFVEQSAGKVHVTKNKLLAHLFGSKVMHRMQPSFDIDRSGKATLEDIRNSKVLSARIPHQAWRGFNADPDMRKPGAHPFEGYDPKDAVHKNHAATTTKRISPKYVGGGEGGKGILNFVHKNHLKNYYRSADGRARGLKGVALAGLGTAIAGFAAHSFKKNHE